jgi:hypothetical protein
MSDSVGRCNKGQDAKVKQTDGTGTITLSLNGKHFYLQLKITFISNEYRILSDIAFNNF